MADLNDDTGTPYTQQQIDEAREMVAAADKARSDRINAEAAAAAAAREARDAQVAQIARMPEVEAVRAAIVALPSETLTERPDISYVAGALGRLQSNFPAAVQ